MEEMMQGKKETLDADIRQPAACPLPESRPPNYVSGDQPYHPMQGVMEHRDKGYPDKEKERSARAEEEEEQEDSEPPRRQRMGKGKS